MLPVNALPTLSFDGRCPLCSREIAALRPRSAGKLELVDIHAILAGESTVQLSAEQRQTLLLQLHLQMPDGHLHIGLAANIAAWEITGGHWLLFVFKLPGAYAVGKIIYSAWAKVRYRRLYCPVR